MRIIGITGGVASGKSTVARQFAQLGAGVLDADQAGREALRLPQVEAAARRRWGETVFTPDGRIDRTRLAGVVFAPGPEAQRERNYLEQLTHPEIAGLVRQQADALAAAGVKIAVLDAPLLVEAGWDDWCEKTVFVERRRRSGSAGRWPAVGRRRILRPARALKSRWIISVRTPMLSLITPVPRNGLRLRSSSFGRPLSVDSHPRQAFPTQTSLNRPAAPGCCEHGLLERRKVLGRRRVSK